MIIPTAGDLVAQAVALEERAQLLNEQESRLQRLSEDLAGVSARVKALDDREAVLKARISVLSDQEESVREQRKAVAKDVQSVAEREHAVQVAQRDADGTLSQAEAVAGAASLQQTACDQRIHDLDERDQQVREREASVTSREVSLESCQQAFDLERVARVQTEEATCSARSVALDQQATTQVAQGEHLAHVSRKLDQRAQVLNDKLAACGQLEANLTALQATLTEQQAEVSTREGACAEAEKKSTDWKDALEVRELRAEKRERQIAQLIEKHQLQADLKG